MPVGCDRQRSAALPRWRRPHHGQTVGWFTVWALPPSTRFGGSAGLNDRTLASDSVRPVHRSRVAGVSTGMPPLKIAGASRLPPP